MQHRHRQFRRAALECMPAGFSTSRIRSMRCSGTGIGDQGFAFKIGRVQAALRRQPVLLRHHGQDFKAEQREGGEFGP
jgi:hypothetical protein